MYYDIAVLSCLIEQPRHGYAIKKILSETLDACSVINNNTLYSLLRKYESHGVIVKTAEVVHSGPKRNMYHITAKGKRYFMQMLREFPDTIGGSRDECVIRLSFFHLLDEHSRSRLLNLRFAYVEKAIAKVEAMVKFEPSLFFPNCKEVHVFHMEILLSEKRLLEEMKGHVLDPCPVDGDGEPF